MARNIELQNTFSGPLDLLLYLVRRDEIDIHDIPIAHVTREYLNEVNKMNNIDVDAGGEFLAMASMLTEIKGRMLLPEANDEEDDDDELYDPRQGLVEALLEYKKFKEIAAELEKMSSDFNERYTRNVEIPQFKISMKDKAEQLGALDLLAAFQRIARKMLNEQAPREIVSEEVPTEVRIKQIEEVVIQRKRASFTSILSDSPTEDEMVGFFIAILELIRLHRIVAQQSVDFSEIYFIDYNEHEKELAKQYPEKDINKQHKENNATTTTTDTIIPAKSFYNYYQLKISNSFSVALKPQQIFSTIKKTNFKLASIFKTVSSVTYNNKPVNIKKPVNFLILKRPQTSTKANNKIAHYKYDLNNPKKIEVNSIKKLSLKNNIQKSIEYKFIKYRLKLAHIFRLLNNKPLKSTPGNIFSDFLKLTLQTFNNTETKRITKNNFALFTKLKPQATVNIRVFSKITGVLSTSTKSTELIKKSVKEITAIKNGTLQNTASSKENNKQPLQIAMITGFSFKKKKYIQYYKKSIADFLTLHTYNSNNIKVNITQDRIFSLFPKSRHSYFNLKVKSSNIKTNKTPNVSKCIYAIKAKKNARKVIFQKPAVHKISNPLKLSSLFSFKTNFQQKRITPANRFSLFTKTTSIYTNNNIKFKNTFPLFTNICFGIICNNHKNKINKTKDEQIPLKIRTPINLKKKIFTIIKQNRSLKISSIFALHFKSNSQKSDLKRNKQHDKFSLFNSANQKILIIPASSNKKQKYSLFTKLQNFIPAQTKCVMQKINIKPQISAPAKNDKKIIPPINKHNKKLSINTLFKNCSNRIKKQFQQKSAETNNKFDMLKIKKNANTLNINKSGKKNKITLF